MNTETSEQSESNNDIRVIVDTDQIERGRHYRGSVQINDLTFSYDIRFDFNFGDLEDLMKADLQKAREGIHIQARDTEGKPVLVDNVARMCLFSTIYDGVSHHYQDARSKRTQGMWGKSLEDMGFATVKFGPVRTEMTYPALSQFQEFLARYSGQ